MQDRQAHATPIEQLVSGFQTDLERGLTQQEAQERLRKFGANELTREERASPVALFFDQFKSTLIIILLVATVLSAVLGEIVDAVIIFVIVLFCAVLGFVQEYRADQALNALKRMLAHTITVLRDGVEARVPSREIVPGDILLLEAGDRIPADARLAEIHSLKCDEAPLTGESFPVAKSLALLAPDVAIGDRLNVVFAGTTVAYGRGKAIVTGTGMSSEFGKIAEQLSTVVREASPLEKRTAEIGRWLGLIALGVCAVAILVSIVRAWMGDQLNIELVLTMSMFAIALAVAAVPEALAAIVTGALAVAMHEMAKRNALVRRMPAVETLGCTTVICTDKTGTLTKGEMTVRRVFGGGRTSEVSGTGYAPSGSFDPPLPLEDDAVRLLLTGGVLCSDAALSDDAGRWFVKGDSTEGALVVLAAKAGLQQRETRLEAPRIAELPFSSERKRMTTVHRMPDGRHLAFVKGAPEVLLERCVAEQRQDRQLPLTGEARAHILAANEKMAKDALRVLALAYREVRADGPHEEEAVECDLTFLGLIGMMDPPRDEAKEAVRICRQVHIRPIMITGDHKLTAVAVAAEIDIHRDGDMVLTGDELARMSDDEYERIVDRVTVYARVSPMDKLRIVRAWKNRGEIVAMTGDGVNDAPALKHADIGIAMGISGTDVAKEAADMVLADDNFATIVAAIERGRWIYDNIKKYLTYLLRANITEVVVLGGVVIVMGPELLPLLPAAILYINLATDGLPALALGLAPPDRDIMRRPPRDPAESVFSRDVRLLVLLGVLIECPIFLWVYFDNYADIESARTKIFLLFVFVELIISMGFRSLRYSLFQAPPHKWLLLAIGWELALFAVLVQIPVVRETFGIRMPTWSDLGLALGVSALVLLAIELTKAYARARMTHGSGGRARPMDAVPSSAQFRERPPAATGATQAPLSGAPLAGLAQREEALASVLQQFAGGNAMLKVLIPVDGSPNSRFAVQHVIQQFMNNTAMEIHLLNVQAPFRRHVARFVSRKTLRDYHRDEARKALAPIRQMLDNFGIPYAVHAEVGDRAKTITESARRLHCDHIVIGTARKNSLTRMVENSVTNKVLELTPVPVEVIAGDAMSRWERYGIPAGIAAALALMFAAAD
ncbi:MAG: HAD-IC family P-type ATPase [Burkholderiales bacterium]|nr:HAD-IC family P-type ATPase [Burkholderiales bacterium]